MIGEIQRNDAHRVWDIYHKVVRSLERTLPLYPTAPQQYSARNLLAYLAYKQHVTTEFLTVIKERGLTISTWEHMVHSLALCCVNAGLMKPPDRYPSLSSPLEARSAALFGVRRDSRSPHIMLTLDTGIANPQTLERLLMNGMSIARINCAHDDAASWLQMIANIRQAEKQLRAQGLYEHRACKVMMDLAGPKIRIQTVVKETSVIKIGNTAIGLITSVDTMDATSDRNIDFYISVSRLHEPMKLLAGDQLTFRDRRNKKRSMTVTRVTPQHVYVQANQPAYIGEGTRLTNNEKQLFMDIVRVRLNGSQVRVSENDRIRVLRKPMQETSMTPDEIVCLTVNLPHSLSPVMAGHSVYFDDGKAQGKVIASTDAYFDVEIVSPRSPVAISSGNGINFPDTDLSGSSGTLTDKDIRDLSFISRHADIVGLSFLHHPDDLRAIGRTIQHANPELAIVAKIETKHAVQNFSNLLFEGLAFKRFGVMIARGDLAIEAGFRHLSVIQEEILPMCRAAHLPVILATQILDTFAKKGMPTRPELSDLSFGSEFDCIMLNKGPYMVNVVNFIAETFVMLAQMKSNEQSITRPE